VEIERPTDIERLGEAIRDELRVQLGMAGLDIEDDAADSLAAMVSSRIDYGFNVEWAPKWVTPGDPHRWQELDNDSLSGEWHFRECLMCGRVTRHANSDEADADYRSHFAEEHQIPG
jgi:hypothetical protein